MPHLLDLHGYKVVLSVEQPKSEDAAGECEPLDDGSYYLRVAPTLNPRALSEVAVHELIEAVNCLYDLELNHTQIQTLGVGLSALLPHEEFAAFLRGGTKGKKKR